MTTMTITVTEDRMAKLAELAKRFNLTVAQLIDIAIEDLLARPDHLLLQSVERVRKTT
jgi:hypothetical protein